METELTDEEYDAYLEWLRLVTIEEMKSVRGNPEGQKQALCRYWRRTELAGLSGGKAMDYLAVDDGSILEKAGHAPEEPAAFMGSMAGVFMGEFGDAPLQHSSHAACHRYCIVGTLARRLFAQAQVIHSNANDIADLLILIGNYNQLGDN